MKHSPSLPASQTMLCSLAVLLTAATSVVAQSDDFNDGNDTGWTRLDVLAPFNGGQGAEFNFPNGGYQIVAYLSPDSGNLGPGRAFSLRSGVTYTDFYVAVDVVAFDQQLDQAFGIIARATNPGLGTTDGYVLNYNPRQSQSSGQLQINLAFGEQPTTIGTADVLLDSNKDYRFVFTGVGTQLTGQVYELPNLTSPIISVSATDPNFASGVCGLFVYDRSDVSNANATFDNYVAAATPPPTLPDAPTLTSVGVLNGQFRFAFPAQPGFTYQVQRANALPAQPQDWTGVENYPPVSGSTVAQLFSTPATGGPGFFRVVSPAQ